MRDFQSKKRWKSILGNKFFIFILIIILVFFAINLFQLFISMKETVQKRKIAEEKVLELINRKEKLLIDIEKLDTDSGKEIIFRESFGLSKPGEEMILIIDEQLENEEQINVKNNFWHRIFKK